MCIFRFRCGILSSGRASRGRLARFLDVCPSVCVSSVSGKGNDFEDSLLAVVRTGQGFGFGSQSQSAGEGQSQSAAKEEGNCNRL